MTTTEAVRTTTGSPAAVWALLADAPSWARWGGWGKVAGSRAAASIAPGRSGCSTPGPCTSASA